MEASLGMTWSKQADASRGIGSSGRRGAQYLGRRFYRRIVLQLSLFKYNKKKSISFYYENVYPSPDGALPLFA